MFVYLNDFDKKVNIDIEKLDLKNISEKEKSHIKYRLNNFINSSIKIIDLYHNMFSFSKNFILSLQLFENINDNRIFLEYDNINVNMGFMLNCIRFDNECFNNLNEQDIIYLTSIVLFELENYYKKSIHFEQHLRIRKDL